MWFISYYLRPVSELLKVRLASMCYPDMQNINIKTTSNFSLYTMFLLVVLVIYFKKST